MTRFTTKQTIYGLFLGGSNANQAFLIVQQNDVLQWKPKRSTVYEWFKEFKEGKLILEDKKGRGRKRTVVTAANIEEVKDCFDANRGKTIATISLETGIKKTSVVKIMKEELNVKKLRAIGIPHQLKDQEKFRRMEWCIEMLHRFQQNKQGFADSVYTGDETYLFFETVYLGTEKKWMYPDEDYPKQVKFSKFTYNKRMYFLFFNRQGDCHIGYQPLNTAAKQENYINQLEQLIFNSHLDTKEIIIHDDNAPIHRSSMVQLFQTNNGIELTGHPAYSPDLAPNDFWLIRKVKKALRGKTFETEDELLIQVSKIIEEIPKDDFKKCFDVWLIRMQKCIDAYGEYFECKKRGDRNKVRETMSS